MITHSKVLEKNNYPNLEQISTLSQMYESFLSCFFGLHIKEYTCITPLYVYCYIIGEGWFSVGRFDYNGA